MRSWKNGRGLNYIFQLHDRCIDSVLHTHEHILRRTHAVAGAVHSRPFPSCTHRWIFFLCGWWIFDCIHNTRISGAGFLIPPQQDVSRDLSKSGWEDLLGRDEPLAPAPPPLFPSPSRTGARTKPCHVSRHRTRCPAFRCLSRVQSARCPGADRGFRSLSSFSWTGPRMVRRRSTSRGVEGAHKWRLRPHVRSCKTLGASKRGANSPVEMARRRMRR